MNWNDNRIIKRGRCVNMEDTLYLSYSASYIEFIFKGRKLDAIIVSDGYDEEGTDTFSSFFGVFIDDEEKPSRHVRVKKGMDTYSIYESDVVSTVKIRIMKYSEAAFASLGIKTFLMDGEILECREAVRPTIEFIGDSITCGYGVEASNGTMPFCTKEENPWEAYACRAARKLGFNYELISWSGNGIVSHYIDPSVDEKRIDPALMPEIYPYTDFELCKRLGVKQIFYKYQNEPECVVINLGTNDCSYTKNKAERNAMFEIGYDAFLDEVRQIHPHAHIICICGIMDERLNNSIRLVCEMRKKCDKKIHFLEFAVQSDEDGRGADFHPSKITHEKVASALVDYIKNNGI